MHRQSNTVSEGRPRTQSTDGGPESSGGADRGRRLFAGIQDPAVEFELTDVAPVVLDVNAAFVETFGYDAETVVGESLNEYVVPEWLLTEAACLDSRTAAGERTDRRVRRETAHGLREFRYRGIPYESADGRPCGFAIYTDLTENRRNESRIEVLHRVLRHNLRNEVGILGGSLDELADRLNAGSEVHDLATSARESARGLVRLAEDAQEIQRTLDAPVPDDASVDLPDLVETVAERVQSTHPRVDVTLDLAETPPVVATDRLAVAVTELLTNAVVHNPDPEPAVSVTVEPSAQPAWIDLVVADDGPRIPDDDRAVIAGDADITPTHHGSGLGLWLVRWTIERFGGRVTFADGVGGGNEVRLRLCRRPDA